MNLIILIKPQFVEKIIAGEKNMNSDTESIKEVDKSSIIKFKFKIFRNLFNNFL